MNNIFAPKIKILSLDAQKLKICLLLHFFRSPCMVYSCEEITLPSIDGDSTTSAHNQVLHNPVSLPRTVEDLVRKPNVAEVIFKKSMSEIN